MALTDPLLRWARTSALAGALVWLALVFIPPNDLFRIELIEKLLLLGVLVVVPLGLLLVATPDRHGRHSRLYRASVLGQPFGAIMAVCSFLLPQGIWAALLASGWLIVTVLIALFGLVRFVSRGAMRAEEISIDAGLIYLSVGGGWFIFARMGLQPLGFGDTIVLLTAVHFHYAGFAAPILAGLAGRKLPDSSVWLRRALRAASFGIIAGTPLVAAGITFSPVLGLVGTFIVAAGLWLLAALVSGWVAPALKSRAAQILLLVSSASSLVAMALAFAYAYSLVSKQLIINIPQMAMSHGIANALGFSLCGLIAWSFLRPASRVLPPGTPFSRLSSRGRVGPDYFQRCGALSSRKQQPAGLVDNLDIYRRADFDPEAVHKDVRSFYEETYRYGLLVRPRWKAGFRMGGRVWHSLGTWLGQMRLPVATESAEDRIESRILPIEDALDGRQNVRAWVRTYEGTAHAMYVAAYATHTMLGNTYMNIAFPIIGGNITSILQIDLLGTEGATNRGVVLSTLPGAHVGGDQGVYFANRYLPVRLPINETIRVWPVEMKDVPFGIEESHERSATVLARHDMWIFGIKFLELDYFIFPDKRAPADRKEQGSSLVDRDRPVDGLE